MNKEADNPEEGGMRNKLIVGIIYAVLGAPGFMANAMATAVEPETNEQMDWAGTYIGVQGLYGRGSVSWNFPLVYPDRSEFRARPSGAMGGIFAGWNHRVGSKLLGVEANINQGSIRQKQLGSLSATLPEDTFETKIDWLHTLTAKFGGSNENGMLYVKGGLAVAHLIVEAVSPTPVQVSGRPRRLQNGWTLGTGVNCALSSKIAVGLEYGFVRLNNHQYYQHVDFPDAVLMADLRRPYLHTFSARLIFKQ